MLKFPGKPQMNPGNETIKFLVVPQNLKKVPACPDGCIDQTQETLLPRLIALLLNLLNHTLTMAEQHPLLFFFQSVD